MKSSTSWPRPRATWIAAMSAILLISAKVHAHEIDLGRIHVWHPWAEPASLGTTTRLHLAITNDESRLIVLLGVKTDVSSSARLVVRVGPEKTRALGSTVVLSGETLHLDTSHMWFELAELNRDLREGDRFTARLELNGYHFVPFTVEVGPPETGRQH